MLHFNRPSAHSPPPGAPRRARTGQIGHPRRQRIRPLFAGAGLHNVCRADHIDVKVTVDWREQFKMLKLVFPINVIFSRQTYEIPYGLIEREHNGEEEPGQSVGRLFGHHRETNRVYGVS